MHNQVLACPSNNGPSLVKADKSRSVIFSQKRRLPNRSGRVAQWIARWTSDPEVVGSSPTSIDFLLFSLSFLPQMPREWYCPFKSFIMYAHSWIVYFEVCS